MSENANYKAIIIGSGPAGYTAAIYLGRANIPHILLEGSQPGGQLMVDKGLTVESGTKVVA